MKKTQLIKNYWLNTPEGFFERYQYSFLNKLSPVTMFLHSRRQKVLKFAGDIYKKKVLDVGCGSGLFMAEFIKRGAYVVGIDYSEKMLKEAKKLFSEFKFPKNKYSLMNADATNLPFKKREFDLVLATGLADYLTYNQNLLLIRRLSRIINKKGSLIIGFPASDSKFAFLRSGIGLFLRQHLFKLPPIYSEFTETKIKSLLAKGSFEEVKKEKVFSTMWLVLARRK